MSDTHTSKKKRTASKRPEKALQEQVAEVLDQLEKSLGHLSTELRSSQDLTLVLQSGLRLVRRDVNDTHSLYNPGSRPVPTEKRLQRALEEVDPVLAFCIAAMLGKADLQEVLEESALRRYVAKSDTYDAVLQEHVPENLRKDAAPLVAQRRYRDGSNATADDDWESFLTNYREQSGGLTTGLPKLDSALGGGFSGLSVAAADEGDGKTSVCLTMMVAALREDPQLGCVYLTIDQSKSKTMAKLYSLISGLSPDVLRKDPENRTATDNAAVEKAAEELQNDLLPRIKFVERSNLSSDEPVDSMLRQFHEGLFDNSEPVYRILVVVDMFQSLVQLHQTTGTPNEADEACLDAIQRFILWSRHDDCPEGSPVILVSEVRKVDRVELTSNDLRGSARLGSAPDNILLMWPTPGTEQSGQTVSRTLRVAKSRHGDEGLIALDFHHKICRFTETPTGSKSEPTDGSPRSSKRTSRRSRGDAL